MALRVRPAEWLLVGYGAVVVGTAVSRASRYPDAWWAAIAHLLVIALVGLFALSTRRSAAGEAIRALAPIVLLLALYGALDLLSGYGAEPTHDRAIRRLEVAWFGGEPARSWWTRLPAEPWSTLLHASYLTYYLIVPAPVILFLARRRTDLVARTTFGLLLGFALCYLVFIYFPVAGPYYEYPRPDPAFLDNWAAGAVYGILSGGSSYGAAFPSSHVAAAWIAAAMAAAGSPRLGALLGSAAALLTVAVVYCQMHYAIDAVAGIGVAAVATAATHAVIPSARRTARDS